MSSSESAADALPSGGEPPAQKSRVKSKLAVGRRLARIAYRDPEHVAERLTLFGSQHLGDDSAEWANRVQEERPDTPRGEVAEEVRIQTAQVARIDGAVSGTPFLIALVPGYLAYLWQEGVMERRMAALYGNDPSDLEASARILMLRGVHPSVDAAREALQAVADMPVPEKPTARRPLRTWVRSVWVLLIFGGFIGAPTADSDRDKYAHWRLHAVIGFLIGGLIWVTTWVLPLSFMIVMAWACESHARSLGQRTMRFYGGDAAIAEAKITGDDEDGGRTKRDLLRGGLLLLSLAVPIAFVAYANHVRQTTGVNWIGALGALVAVSLVIAMTVFARRR